MKLKQRQTFNEASANGPSGDYNSGVNVKIKYARGDAHSARPPEGELNPSDILTRYSMKTELTLSLP